MATYREDPAGIAEIQARAAAVLPKIAAAIESDAKRFVPVDTGLLKSRIKADEAATVAGRLVRIRIWARTHYAAYVELGTSKMRAQPYLRPALYRHRGK